MKLVTIFAATTLLVSGVANAAATSMSIGDMIAARQDFYDLGSVSVDNTAGQAYAMTAVRNSSFWGPPTWPAMILIDAPGFPAGEKIVEYGQVDCVHMQFRPLIRLFYTKTGVMADGASTMPTAGMISWLTPDAIETAAKVFCHGFTPEHVIKGTTLSEVGVG